MVRVDQPGPNLGGSQCPAWQFTFTVSEDDGASWRNPTTEEKEELAQAIRDNRTLLPARHNNLLGAKIEDSGRR